MAEALSLSPTALVRGPYQWIPMLAGASGLDAALSDGMPGALSIVIDVHRPSCSIRVHAELPHTVSHQLQRVGIRSMMSIKDLNI